MSSGALLDALDASGSLLEVADNDEDEVLQPALADVSDGALPALASITDVARMATLF